jgi:3-phosphoshikimate 1-carboxyvinyltransferase
MKVISPLKINGSIDAPPSKSAMIRVVAASLLSSGRSVILNPSFCSDALAALTIADTLGAEICEGENRVVIRGNGGLKKKNFKGNTIQCGESGLCMRMFTPVAGLTDEEFILKGSGSLLSRPMRMVEALVALGAQCETNNGYSPIRVKGAMSGGKIDIDGAQSSQFLTGLLLSLPLCKEDSTIAVSHLKSKPYAEMTVDILKKFGITVSHDENLEEFYIKGNQQYTPCTCTVEGDWSGAAFFLVAGAIAGTIKVRGLHIDSCQADKAVVEALRRAGAEIWIGDDYVSVEKNGLNAIEFDARDCPDLVPPLVALSAHCVGTSVIYGVERLRHKETDRARALISEFSKLGIEIGLFENRMEIRGDKITGNTRIDPHNDHRIAMACAVAAINGKDNVAIENPACVYKSYPSFFEDLNTVGVVS